MDVAMYRLMMGAWICGLLWLGGCGKAAPVTVEIRGELKTAAGTACGGALIVFHPQEPDRVNAAKPVAIAEADGSFVVRTFSDADGAEPGNYKITVVWPQAKNAKEGQMSLSSEGGEVGGGPDRLKGAYGDPNTTTLQVTIKPADNEPLKLTVNE
jgi:hypothetical protein